MEARMDLEDDRFQLLRDRLVDLDSKTTIRLDKDSSSSKVVAEVI